MQKTRPECGLETTIRLIIIITLSLRIQFIKRINIVTTDVRSITVRTSCLNFSLLLIQKNSKLLR